jgi:hypothetical protein
VFGTEVGRRLWVDRKRVASPSRQTGRASKLSVLSNAQKEDKISFLNHHTRTPAGRQGEQGKLSIGMLSGMRRFLTMRILVRNFLTFVRKK